MNKPTDIIISGAPHKSGELKNHPGANVFKNRTANPVVLVLLGVNELMSWKNFVHCASASYLSVQHSSQSAAYLFIYFGNGQKVASCRLSRRN